MLRYFWLSFGDDNRPPGQQFLGSAIVTVNEEEIAEAKATIDIRFPKHAEGAELMMAVLHKAYLMGCNPGGQVAAWEFNHPEGIPKNVPLHRLMQKAELDALGLDLTRDK